MLPNSLSRRAASLAASLPVSAPAANLAFDSGHASNAVLPDLTAEAERALTVYRAETLQYAPRPGLADLRARIVEQMAADGITATRENVLVTNGAKHAIDLFLQGRSPTEGLFPAICYSDFNYLINFWSDWAQGNIR